MFETSRRPLAITLAIVLAIALAVSATRTSTAAAQGFVRGEPSAFRFYSAPGPGGYLGVDGLAMGRDLVPSAGLMIDYAYRPYALDNPPSLVGELDVVEEMAVMQLTGAFSLAGLLEIGLGVPIILWHEGRELRDPFLPGHSGTRLGDPRLSAKLRIFEERIADELFFGLGASAWITFPVARQFAFRSYSGDPNVSGGAHAIANLRWRSFRATINLGFAIHEDAQLFDSRRTSEMTWGLAASYDFIEWVGALAEIQGGTTFGQVFDNEAPTELRFAALAHVEGFTFSLGAGFGLGYAVGVPVARALGGVTWQLQEDSHSDSDTIPDSLDACPADPEDVDGHDDENGCPDIDNDGDEIPDERDACVDEPEDDDGRDDEDGCPDLDDDGDGVRDGYDSCPEAQEDVDGDRDEDGCPDDDRDRDRIDDAQDRCPEEPEDTDGLGDEDGCPETDFDDDGVPDDHDECAEEAEDRDGFEDENGCPEEGGRRPRR